MNILCIVGYFVLLLTRTESCMMNAKDGEAISAMKKNTKTSTNPENKSNVTILGFGSLLSESSSRLTFPMLKNFRLGRVTNHRRVFRHPASIFFQRGIADFSQKTMSSLSIEPHPGSSFVASVFEVQRSEVYDEHGRISGAFLEREEEFDIRSVSFCDGLEPDAPTAQGIACLASTDELYIDRWGEDHFQHHYGQYGIDTIWGWGPNSGLLPCSVYLRHCYLAAQSMGDACFQSFLNDTYLVDRITTVRAYVQSYPKVLMTAPPLELSSRYSG